MEVILLAGGLGTRLQSVVSDVPKCMSMVAGKPFLDHLFHYLEQQFVDHVILSLGYKHEVVIDWLRSKAFTCKVSWVIEQEPLGTGGAIKYAMQKAKENWVYVMNADTYFPIPLSSLKPQPIDDATIGYIALKSLENFDRYGHVVLDEENNITAFNEKQPMQTGLINGGIYLLQRNAIDWNNYPKQFSFENDFLIPNAALKNLKGKIFENTFIDIGIPEDYLNAQNIDYK